jgi:ArsR family metal-binding transcriptional regulator
VAPCLADPGKIRFTSEFDRDVSEIFPYLNAVLPGAIYHHAGKTLTLRREGRLVTLHARRLAAAKVRDLDDARALADWILETINDCDRRRLEIDPDFRRRDRLTVLDLVKLLPGTNCRKCGLATCLAFAAALSEERVSALACADLFLEPYREKRRELLALLQAGGYSVPEDYLESPQV